MFKFIIAATVLLLAGILLAEEAAGPVLTPYGFAQYRLRGQILGMTMVNKDAFTEYDYTNRVSYYLGLKIKVNSQVSMQFQAGNDWVSTDEVNWYNNDNAQPGLKDPNPKGGLYPYFHLAFVKYDPGFLYVLAGKVPVANNGPLDLLERSLRTGNYMGASLVSWLVGTNGAMTGLKVGAPILKKEFKLGAELFTTVDTSRFETPLQAFGPAPSTNPSAVMLLLDLPMSVAALTVTPQVVSVINRNYSQALGQGDNEIGFGLSAAYKIMDGHSVSGTFGMAMLSNKNSTDSARKASNYAYYDNNGMVVGVGSADKIGPGNLYFDIKYSSNEDLQASKVKNSTTGFTFMDLKYGWACNKNFIIMPRIRYFMTTYSKSDARDFKMEIRPELIFTGQF